MCTAALTANLPSIMGLLGVGLQAYGTYQQVSAQNQANEFNARMAEQNAATAAQNADIAKQQSSGAIREGEIEEKQHRLRVAQLKGEQRTSFAGGGVVVDRGSAMDTLQDTTKWGELDALTIRTNAAKEAWGYDVEARNYKTQQNALTSQASMYRSQKRSPLLPVATTLLTGGNRLAGVFF